MLVRIRSRDGNFRFDLQPTDDVSVLVDKILETSEAIDVATLALSNSPRGGENLVSGITGDLQSIGISHGDLLFASYSPKAAAANSLTPSLPLSSTIADTVPSTSSSTLSGKIVKNDVINIPVTNPNHSSKGHSAPKQWELVEEDEVDQFWAKKDGKIQRKKGTDLCKCGPKAMCDYCMPLEPYDTGYQASHAIKHLSYYSYLRKINSSAPLSAQSTSYIPPLSDPSYRVAVPCTSGSHPSWPAGICTKCQPSAVTLSRQVFRMVDHVEFAKPDLIEGLLSFWRATGTQRFGYLLGRYEPYEEVPMGIKAVVEAIHEPPQEPHEDGVTVGFPWEERERVEQMLAPACGLKVVGMIYTDLTADTSDADKKKSGKVVCKRHANSFFLSSLEVMFSATLQRSRPNPSRYSQSSEFSSRFVTCVLSGDLEGGIAVEAYQVSDQAMAMVDADMIEASVDPGVMRVKEELPTRYIPDVFYRYKNKYEIEVKESAKPCFPVEYLLVNVTHGFPKAPNPLFVATSNPFPTENRAGFQEQSISIVATGFSALAKEVPEHLLHGDFSNLLDTNDKGKGKEGDLGKVMKVLSWLSDWHLLNFLDGMGIFDQNDMKLMAEAASSKDLSKLARLFQTPSWHTFLTIIQETSAPAVPTRNYPGPGAGIAADSGLAGDTFDDGFEIPPDVDVPPDGFGDIDMSGMTEGGGGQGTMSDISSGVVSGTRTPIISADTDEGEGGGGGIVVCPHCTFENQAGTVDCEICGLPLGG